MSNINSNPDEISLGLGGLHLSFRAVRPGFRLTLRPALWPYRTQLPPEILFRMHNQPAPIADFGQASFDSGGNWSLHTWQGRNVLRVNAIGQEPNLPTYVIVFDAGGSQGDYYYESVNGVGPPDVVPVLGAPLDEILLVHLLAHGCGVLFHAAGVSLNGQGLLFAGKSRSGKSTLMNLWKNVGEAVLLGDERISMRKQADGYWIYGTPWSSSAGVASPDSAPLEAVFILKHGSKNQAIRLKPSVAASSLLARSFSPFWDSEGMAFTLKFLDELVQTVPCYELNLLPDPSAVEYVRWMLSL